MDALKSDLAMIKDDLKTFAADAATAGKHGAAFARDKAQAAADYATERGRAAYGVAKEKSAAAAEKAEETIVDHPFASVAVAFGVGVLLGAVISRR
jgi:ElaB/YqjD/DUF883 family membrane-anchored ribosome-binding protein